MKTKRLVADGTEAATHYEEAVQALRSGELVAFPTETVYGLGALATDEEAVQSIFTAKGRPSDNPLIVHIGDQEQVREFARSVDDVAEQLMDAFWPGPLTLIFYKKENVLAPSVTAGLETVGLRMPDHPVALQLLRAIREPIAAPSANKSGKPSPTEADHVFTDLDGDVRVIIDGGSTAIGVESTILDLTTDVPTILRPGGVTKEQLERVIGPVEEDVAVGKEEAPRAPGMKYMHYAPEAPLFVFNLATARLNEAIEAIHASGQKVAVVGPEELYDDEADWYFTIGRLHHPDEMAANLYRALRQCDLTDADVILAIETDMHGVGQAVMNRLTKASGGKTYESKQ